MASLENSRARQIGVPLRVWADKLRGDISALEAKILGLFALFLLFASALQYGLKNLAHLQHAGDTWVHADWLISYQAGFVRRGLSGEIVLAISDFIGANPLNVVVSIQIISVCAMMMVVGYCLIRFRFPPAVTILAITPTFAIFWHNIDGAHAKDVFAFLSFAPLLLVSLGSLRPVWGYGLSAAIFLLACGFYEPAVFFAPALVIAAVLGSPVGTLKKSVKLYAIVIAMIAIVWALLSATFAQVDDSAGLCDPLLSRGLYEHICIKFSWHSAHVDHALSYVSERLARRHWAEYGLAVVLSALPIAMIVRWTAVERKLIFIAMAQAIAFVPLFVLATDYGRWLNIQTTSILLIVFAAAAAGRFPSLLAPAQPRRIYLFACLALIWGVSPILGAMTPGFIGKVIANFCCGLG